jgi:hypothetical protein
VDLQTLFGQTPQVARDQGAQQGLVPQAQALQAGQLAQQAVRQDSTVTQARQTDEGPEQARIRHQRERRRRRGRERSATEPPAAPPPAHPASATGEELRDPALGRHVDVSG